MTDEATLIEGIAYINPTNRTCASTATIEKGELLILNPANTISGTASAPVASGNIFGGIAAAEKSATDDTSTTIAAHVHGVFDCRVSGTLTGVGQYVKLASGTNVFEVASSTDLAAGRAAGKIEEVVTNTGVVRVRLLGY